MLFKTIPTITNTAGMMTRNTGCDKFLLMQAVNLRILEEGGRSEPGYVRCQTGAEVHATVARVARSSTSYAPLRRRHDQIDCTGARPLKKGQNRLGVFRSWRLEREQNSPSPPRPSSCEAGKGARSKRDFWWRWTDSNCRRRGYEPRAQTGPATPPSSEVSNYAGFMQSSRR